MAIPNEIIPVAYEVSKRFYNKQISLTKAKNEIHARTGMDKASAQDYIYNFKHLMKGERFTRALNAFSVEYYLQNILNEFGKNQLKISLQSLIEHIVYYENIRKTNMLTLRDIHKRYSSLAEPAPLISFLGDVLHNINTIENYLTEGTRSERIYSSTLISRGICFVAYKVDNEFRFAPSKFLGYCKNEQGKYPASEKYGGDTNTAISNILGSEPFESDKLEEEYLHYCENFGIKPNPTGSNKRRYWLLELEKDFDNNCLLSGEFPEGKIIERTHKSRERNFQVIDIAKLNFKKKYGSLFCEVCGFDFEKEYGIIGKDFIEGHHIKPVSEMQPDDNTKPEDIAMLCSNCHKMIHKRRPWLTMDSLKKLLEKQMPTAKY